MNMRLVLLACAIEGEPGSDPGTYQRCVEGYKRYLNVGIFPAGDAYESMGKNFLFVDNLVPIAARGTNLPALKKVRSRSAATTCTPWTPGAATSRSTTRSAGAATRLRCLTRR